MKPPSEEDQDATPDEGEDLRDRLIGLGRRSMRKSYYPELRDRMEDLERFRLLLDVSSDLIFLLEGESGRVADVNKTACLKTGTPREALLGMTLTSLVEPGHALALGTMLKAGQADREEPMLTSLPLAGGGRFPAEITLNFLGLDRRSMAVAVARDVTTRMEAQAQLRRAWGYLRSIVDAMPSILLVVDAGGVISLINSHGAALAGAPADALPGCFLGNVFPWLPELPQALQDAIREGTPRTLRKIAGRGPSGPAWYDATIFPLPLNGRVEAVARLDDVTARVKMEEVLVQTEKMLSVGALAAGMAHEINNPLAGILQGAQTVIRRLSPDLDANRRAAREAGLDLDALRAYLTAREVDTLLKGIQESGVRASRIVSNILEFSRRTDASKAQVRVGALVDKALELAVSEFDLKKKYDFRHIRIVRHDDPQLPAVWCVPTQIEQVILNLDKNAAQAMATAATPAPEITISTGLCEGLACIEVQDNGPGMDDPTRERVFEPFFTTKGPGEGTGLGLSVVYYIVVEQHGGRVGVRAAPGGGSVISVRLPLPDAGAPGGERQAAPGAALGT